MANINGPGDSELYNRFRHGDTKAYDQLMIRYGNDLTLFLYGYLHDWQDAEDLMIESFARIMAKRPKIGEDKFKAYLFRTGRNLASRFHARKTRISQFSFDEYEIDIAGKELVEEKLVGDERREAVRKCLDRIDPQLREALWLVYVEGMSYAEAAKIMKVTSKRIDHLLQRGKKQMRIELEKEGVAGAYR